MDAKGRVPVIGWWKKRRATPFDGHCVPAGTRVYAVGDVHGCLDSLDELTAAIEQDCLDFEGEVQTVLLGDLVDRGPASAGVVERARVGLLSRAVQHVLMGNHEEAMLRVYDGDLDPRDWLRFGGMQTLESYGITRQEHFGRGFDLGRRMHEAIPAQHIAFLRGLPDFLQIGDYLFVHAGIRPGVTIEQQRPEDLRWIRRGFLESDADHGLTVVHGHTISPDPEVRGNRIGIDTGCYAGGRLTALVLEADQRRFLSVDGPAAV